jgi:4-hydroxy-4-methyl-2-oxoglutarate aldolase
MTNGEYLADLQRLGATDVSDALDQFGIDGQRRGIVSLDRSFQVVGRAWILNVKQCESEAPVRAELRIAQR